MEDAAPIWAINLAKVVAILVPSGAAVIGLWFLFRKKKTEADTANQDAQDARAFRIKREALAEAWDTVDRVNEMLKANEQELRVTRDLLSKCEKDRAVLRLIASWARRNGMPMTPEIDELLKESSGSGIHSLMKNEGES